jgi:Putative adhesin
MRRDALRRPGYLAMAAAAALLTSACEITVDAGPYSVHEEKRFQVIGTPELSLTTFDGSLEIRSWDRPEVLIEIEKRASDKTMAESIKVRAEQSGRTITVEVKKPDGNQPTFGFKVSPSARIVASVPRSCNIVARSEDGSINIERVDGKIELRTGDGSVRGVDLSGTLRVHTGDGSLRFDDVSGSVDLESGDGGARLTGKLQSVKVKTGDGSVELRAIEGSSMTDDWEVRTGDGGLRLELPENFGANLDASTGDGVVRVRGFGEPTMGGKDEESRRDLKRPLGAGGKLLRLRSNSGTILVRTI